MPRWREWLYPMRCRLVHLRGALRWRVCPLHRSESFGPFFIVAAGRSGTTLLRRILLASPQIHIPPESYVLGDVIDEFRWHRCTMGWDQLVRLVLGIYEFHVEFDTFEISLRPLAQQLKDAPAEKRSLAFMLNALYRYHGEQTHSQFEKWGDKTVTNIFRMDRLHAVFPDARFIHLLRDGVDVAYSFIESKLLEDVELAAGRWKRSVTAARSFMALHPASCLEVRYESLVREPKATVERVCCFLDISFLPSMVESLDHVASMGDAARYEHLANVKKPITTDSVGKGRGLLSSEQKARLKEVIGPLLVETGYESVL